MQTALRLAALGVFCCLVTWGILSIDPHVGPKELREAQLKTTQPPVYPLEFPILESQAGFESIVEEVAAVLKKSELLPLEQEQVLTEIRSALQKRRPTRHDDAEVPFSDSRDFEDPLLPTIKRSAVEHARQIVFSRVQRDSANVKATTRRHLIWA